MNEIRRCLKEMNKILRCLKEINERLRCWKEMNKILQLLMNRINFSSIPLKVQEHSLTINSNLFFPVVNIPPTRFLQLNARLKPNTTLDLSLTTI